MLCPECHQRLVIVEYQDVELDACVEEHGIWFDADELRQLFAGSGVHASLHDLEDRLTSLPASGGGVRRRCPRCGAAMLHVRAPSGGDPDGRGSRGDGESEGVILDRCPRGHGLWFDQGELHEVLAAKIPEGDEALAALREYLGAFVAPRNRNRGAQDA